MDIVKALTGQQNKPIACIDMHTTGEPTRIVYAGYPNLNGTLLEQRAEAKKNHDHIRRRLLYEPRGHFDMYGAVLRPRTELVDNGTAHIGVLFMTNGSGYSTMCGHATIALGRFLLDTHDKSVFPNRDLVQHDPNAETALLKLHCPCGLVEVTVPVLADGSRSDPTRPVTFLSVPSFATGLNVPIPIPTKWRWPELEDRSSIVADFGYGGAFYCVVHVAELGFAPGLKDFDHSAMNIATKKLKACVNDNPALRHLFQHPDHEDLGFLYSIMVRDKSIGLPNHGAEDAETGLCYFADQQIDRSPTGSAVAARVAIAYAEGQMTEHVARTYHSLVSNAWLGDGGFTGSVVQNLGEHNGRPIVRVQVQGSASYTGASTYFVEESDSLGDDGFIFHEL